MLHASPTQSLSNHAAAVPPHPMRCFATSPLSTFTPAEWAAREPERLLSCRIPAVELRGMDGPQDPRREGWRRVGGGSRTLPTGAMHNGCSVQLCSTAEGGSGGGVGVQRGAEAAASLIKACYAPVMPEPRAAHTPYLLVVFPFLVSGFLSP